MTTYSTNISFEEYQNIDAINFSSLKHAKTSLLHMHHAMTNKSLTTSSSMIKGHLIHKALLEADRFYRDVLCCDLNKNTSEFKKLKENNPDKIIVKSEEIKVVEGIVKNVMNNSDAIEIIENTHHEVSVIRDSGYGKIKCRFDCHSDLYKADIKTTHNISDRAYSASKYMYHVQMGWYDEVLNKKSNSEIDWKIIWIETVPPYDVCVDVMNSGCVEIGRIQAKKWAGEYNEAKKSGSFKGVGNGSILNINDRFVLDEDDLLVL